MKKAIIVFAILTTALVIVQIGWAGDEETHYVAWYCDQCGKLTQPGQVIHGPLIFCDEVCRDKYLSKGKSQSYEESLKSGTTVSIEGR